MCLGSQVFTVSPKGSVLRISIWVHWVPGASPRLSPLVPSEWVAGQFGLTQNRLSTLQWCLGKTWTHQPGAVTPLWKEEQRRDPATL